MEVALVTWVAEGKTVQSFCREHDVSSATIYNWLAVDDGSRGTFSRDLAHARVCSEAAWIDQILAIADTPTELRDDVAHRKLQVYAREKRLAWSNPKYQTNSRVQIGGSHDMPPVQMSDVDRVTRIRQLIDKAGQLEEIKPADVVDQDDG